MRPLVLLAVALLLAGPFFARADDVPSFEKEVAPLLVSRCVRCHGDKKPKAGLDMRTRVDGLETELVNEALQKTRGNQTRAAQLLGLSRFGLQKMMKRLKIKSPSL